MRFGGPIFAAFLMLLALGCGSGEEKDEYALNCVPQDQRGSISPRTQGGTTVVVDPGFSPKELTAIREAMATWNAMHGFFKIHTTTAVPAEIRSFDRQNCQAGWTSGENTFYILRENSQDHWRALGFNRSIPGATFRCVQEDRLEVLQQIVTINADSSILDERQFKSVLTHELGHTLGLEHSCNEKGDTSEYIGCNKIGADHPYRQAVMFPSLQERVEIKEKLRENDEARAKCLFHL